jgi:hypothetical protein
MAEWSPERYVATMAGPVLNPSAMRRVYRRFRDVGEWANLQVRETSASQRALPAFLLIGAQKGGTTSMFHYLDAHPAVVPAYEKEINFFAAHYGRGEAWYRAHFPLQATLDRLSDRLGERAVTGDATTWYLDHPHAPARAAALLPDARIVVLLRDPVRRAVSHYHHAVAYGLEDAPTFEEALAREPERLAAEGSFAGLHHRHRSYRARGCYADQLERWFSAFPKEQVLVLGAHELKSNPRATLDRVCAFAGLTPIQGAVTFTRHNSRRYAPQPEPLLTALRAFYAPHNARLFSLLGCEFPW